MEAGIKTHATGLTSRRWLSQRTFEIKFSKPSSYDIKSGQRIRIYHQKSYREYTPVSAPADRDIAFCIRKVDGGEFSTLLSSADIGSRFQISEPGGYFTFKPSSREPIFVATGTGIAPFCSMVGSGVTGFTLIHGVDSPRELYYQSKLESAAAHYVPCISREFQSETPYFRGWVSEWLESNLTPKAHDFYLCGRREMIRDVTWLIDERFPGSLIYSELFY